MKILHSNKINLILAVICVIFVAFGCACPPPNQNPNQTTNPSAPQPFTCAVVIRDRDKNTPVGQVSISLVVGNETVEVKPTDDNGQARFDNIDGKYLGKGAKIYAYSPKYHPKDDEMKLKNDETKILQIVSNDYPITTDIPTPPPAKISQGNTVPSTPVPTPNILVQTIRLNDTKNGEIAEGKKLDFRFEGTDNSSILFKIGTVPSNDYYSIVYGIFDADGFKLKEGFIEGNRDQHQREMPFTPPKNGTYTLRLFGSQHYGGYILSMQPIN
jgi:hypothetical protein